MGKAARKLQARTDPAIAARAALRLASAFSAVCGDLPNIFSEGNPPGRVFHRWILPLDPAIAVTPQTLATALKVRAPRHVDLVDLTDQLDLDPSDWGEETALGFRLLVQAMRATLDRVHIAWIRGGPSASIPTHVFGRLDGGPLVGLRVVTVET
jgi:hypothetical protein